ncbi:MAG: hypothetical protein WBJ03_10720 [Moraxellaceae bacterium]
MIPSNSHDGVLPPFVPEGTPQDPAAVAPYRADLMEVAQRYSTSAPRREILQGLVAYRAALRAVGIDVGFQWVDGSFVEDCEAIRGRAPSDVDVITFSVRPQELSDPELWIQFINSRPDLFDPETTKKLYKCDAYFVDLRAHPIHIVNQTRYWFGLFSHQRDTFLWKGMIEIPLASEDGAVAAFLGQEIAHAS